MIRDRCSSFDVKLGEQRCKDVLVSEIMCNKVAGLCKDKIDIKLVSCLLQSCRKLCKSIGADLLRGAFSECTSIV